MRPADIVCHLAAKNMLVEYLTKQLFEFRRERKLKDFDVCIFFELELAAAAPLSSWSGSQLVGETTRSTQLAKFETND